MRILLAAGLTSWALLASPSGALAAQSSATDSLRTALRLQVPTTEQSRTVIIRPSAGLVPGLVPLEAHDWIRVFVGAAYVPRTRYTDGHHDGNGVIGVSFGDPVDWVGVKTDVAFYSTVREGPFHRMGLDLSVYRLLPLEVLVTLGWENILRRGFSDIGSSRFVMLSRWFTLGQPDEWFNMITLSLAAGDGRFVSESDWLARVNRPNLFGSATVQIVRAVAFTADWQGDDLALGTVLTPLRDVDLIITPGIVDVTGRVGNGARFVVSVGYLFHVRSPF